MTIEQSSTVAIFGLGNELMSDDGVGVHAVRLLKQQDLPGVDIWEAGTRTWHAVDIADNYEHIILIDAVANGNPPGTIYRIEKPVPAEATGPVSLHSVDFFGALSSTPGISASVVLVGVEPETVAYGTSLSPSVALALSELCRLAVKMTQPKSRAEEHAA